MYRRYITIIMVAITSLFTNMRCEATVARSETRTESTKGCSDSSELVEDLKEEGTLWLRIDQVMDYGYDVNKLVENLKEEGTLLTRINRVMNYGYDVNKMVEYLREEGTLWLHIDEVVSHGYDIDKLVEDLELEGTLWLCTDEINEKKTADRAIQ